MGTGARIRLRSQHHIGRVKFRPTPSEASRLVIRFADFVAAQSRAMQRPLGLTDRDDRQTVAASLRHLPRTHSTRKATLATPSYTIGMPPTLRSPCMSTTGGGCSRTRRATRRSSGAPSPSRSTTMGRFGSPHLAPTRIGCVWAVCLPGGALQELCQKPGTSVVRNLQHD